MSDFLPYILYYGFGLMLLFGFFLKQTETADGFDMFFEVCCMIIGAAVWPIVFGNLLATRIKQQLRKRDDHD